MPHGHCRKLTTLSIERPFIPMCSLALRPMGPSISSLIVPRWVTEVGRLCRASWRTKWMLIYGLRPMAIFSEGFARDSAACRSGICRRRAPGDDADCDSRPEIILHQHRPIDHRRCTREIGIRLALGAQKSDLRWMFVRSALALTVVGVALGIGAAAGLTRLMKSVLFEVSPLDPLTYAVVPCILVLCATLASYLPAHRAATLDPVEALRSE